MNITVITDTFLPEINGATISLYRQYNELAKKHHILIICPSHQNNNDNHNNNNSITEEMKLHENIQLLKLPSFSLPSYHDVKIVIPKPSLIKKTLEEFKPNIIHIHTPGLLGYYFFNKKVEIKKIATFHTLVTEQLKYVWLDNNFFESLIWKLLIRMYNKADHIITPTETIKKIIQKRGITRPITVISNGIIEFKAKKNYTKKDKLVYVGRVSYEKNIDILIKAVAIIKKKIPAITITIIGDGPDRKRLQDLTKQLKLENNIVFKGWIPNNQLNQEIINCDILVTASTMETQGIALLEAMACGLPVIGANKYAIPELVKNNGYLFESNNVDDCAKKIIKCLKSDDLRKLGKKSIKIAEEHSLKKTIDELEKTYRKLTT